LERRAPLVRERLLILSRLSRQEFLALAGCLDVLLDPFHFGSGVTLSETFHTGTPVVSLEGRFLRGRFVAAANRPIGQSADRRRRSTDGFHAGGVCVLCGGPDRRPPASAATAPGDRHQGQGPSR
jgi:hypothetical protein